MSGLECRGCAARRSGGGVKGAFTFRIAFSAEVEITPEDMRDHALVVSGGTVTAAAMVDDRKDLWTLTVEPAGTGAVSILVPQDRACTETGGVSALLNPDTARRLAANNDGDELDRRRFEAVLGYGVPMFGHRFVGTPELGLGLTDTGRELRLGWRLGLACGTGRVSLDLALEAARRESAKGEREPEDRIAARLSLRW